jgi:hypothetical protein
MVAEIVSPPESTAANEISTATNAIIDDSDAVATDIGSTHSRGNVVSVPSTPEPSLTMSQQRRQGTLDPPESLSGGIPVDTDDDEVVVLVEEQASGTTTIVDGNNNTTNNRIFSPRADVSVENITNFIRTSPIITNQQQPEPTSNTLPPTDHRGRTVIRSNVNNDSIGTNTITAPPNVTGNTTPSVMPTTANNNNSYHVRQQPQLHSPMSSTIAAQPSHLATTPRSIVTSSSILSSPSYTSNPNNIRCINPASGMC